MNYQKKENDKKQGSEEKSKKINLNLNQKLLEELSILKDKNNQLEKKIKELGPSDKLTELRVNELLKGEEKLKEELNKSLENEKEVRAEYTLLENKFLKVLSELEEEKKGHLNTLRSIKRERDIIQEEEIVDVCKRIICILRLINKFQEKEFPGYVDTLNVINYIREELDRFLMIKQVTEIPIDFRNLTLEKVKIVDRNARSNRILKKGYEVNGKLLEVAEVEVNGLYTLYQFEQKHDKKEETIELRLRSILRECLHQEEELKDRLERYFLEIENRHIIPLPDRFKNFFRLLFVKYVEENPEPDYQRLAYKKVINKITEEFRRIIQKVPERDITRASRASLKKDDELLEKIFSEWYLLIEEEESNLQQQVKIYLKPDLAKDNISQNTFSKFPFKFKDNSSKEEKLAACTWLRRIEYFSNSLSKKLEKEFIKEVGNREDLVRDIEILIKTRQLPADLFELPKIGQREEILSDIFALLGLSDEKQLKKQIKSILLNKRVLTDVNYTRIVTGLFSLDLSGDLSSKKKKLLLFLDSIL